MTLGEFRFFADENIHVDVVAHLRKKGHEVLDVRSEGLVGRPDSELIEFATEKEAVILTHDRDFGRLAIARFNLFTESCSFAQGTRAYSTSLLVWNPLLRLLSI